jgi:multisubunit Na+/H+ antiporter MnhE subunit
MKPTNSVPWYRVVMTVVFWSNVLLVGPRMICHGHRDGAVTVAIGLIMVFFYPLRPNDERARSNRFRAITAGIVVSFVVLYLGTRILPEIDGDPRPTELLEQRFGIWSAIIITLAVAQLLIWFWRLWDSSEEVPMRGWRRVVQMCLTGR